MSSCISPDRCWRRSCTARPLVQLIHVENPKCPVDVLTDRWPASMGEQVQFIEDLRELVKDAERLVNGRRLDEIKDDLD